MKVKSLQFEGTPEEFKAVAYMFDGSHTETERESDEIVTINAKDAIRTMITRRPLPNGQRELYLALINGPLEYDEFTRKMGRTPQQMRGLMGALGKRVNATEEVHQAGLPCDSTLVVKTFQKNDKKYVSLTDDVLEVIKEPDIYKSIPFN